MCSSHLFLTKRQPWLRMPASARTPSPSCQEMVSVSKCKHMRQSRSDKRAYILLLFEFRTPPALRCLEAAAQRFGFTLNFRHFEWASCDYYLKHGKMLPDNWKVHSSRPRFQISSANDILYALLRKPKIHSPSSKNATQSSSGQ